MKKHVITLFSISILLYTACRQEPKGDYGENGCYQGTKPNEVIAHMMGEPKGLGMNEISAGQYTEIMNYIHGWLLEVDDEGKIFPVLAKATPQSSEDGLRYSIELSPDAKWEDGKQVTPEDVLFSIKATICPLSMKVGLESYIENLESVEISKDNPSQIVAKMKTYSVWNEYFFLNFPIVDKRIYDPENRLAKYTVMELMDTKKDWEKDTNLKTFADQFKDSKFGHDPKFVKGLGPYELTTWNAGKEIILSRKANYWAKGKDFYREQQKPDKIIYKLIADPAALEAAFKQGSVDISDRVTPDLFVKFEQDSAIKKDYVLTSAPRSTFAMLLFNTKPDGVKHKKIFDDILVRKAFAYLTPVDEVIKDIMKSFGIRISTPVAPSSKEYNSNLPLISLNAAKGDSLLKAAGWADTDGDKVLDKIINGKKQQLEITITYSKSYEPHARKMTASYEKAGVKVNLEILPAGGSIEKLESRDFDALLFASSNDGSMPLDFKQLWHTENWVDKKGQNFSGFGSPQSDKLIDALRMTQDKTKRIEIAKEIQKMIYDAQPAIFLWQQKGRMVYHKRFSNAKLVKERPYAWLNTFEVKKCD